MKPPALGGAPHQLVAYQDYRMMSYAPTCIILGNEFPIVILPALLTNRLVQGNWPNALWT
jgi:hypothetical protein